MQPAPKPAPPPAPKPAAAKPEVSLLDQIAMVQGNPEMMQYLMDADLAKNVARSQMYANNQEPLQPTQAQIKIQIGRELGLQPMVAVQNVKVQNGNVSFSAELIGALLQREGYTWKFVERTAEAVEIACYYKGERMMDEGGKPASVRWTKKDAETADLLEPRGTSKQKSVYEKYPADLLYWRCIVRMMRWYAPGVTKGMSIVTPDELDEITQAEIHEAEAAGNQLEAQLRARAAEKEAAK